MRETRPTPYEDCVQLYSESIPGGFVRYFADGDEEIIHANKYVIELFECESVEEFLELTQGSFRHFVCDDDLSAVEDSIWGQLKSRKNLDHVYYRIRTKTGRLITVVDYSRLEHDSSYGRPFFEAFVARVSKESAVDWLTGLSGMVRFHELARLGASHMASLGQRVVAVALDITGMKSTGFCAVLPMRCARTLGARHVRALARITSTHSLQKRMWSRRSGPCLPTLARRTSNACLPCAWACISVTRGTTSSSWGLTVRRPLATSTERRGSRTWHGLPTR